MNLSINTKIDINAPASLVWKALTNLEDYSRWNPFVVEASGHVALGAKLICQPRMPNGSQYTFKPTVTRLIPNKEFAWTGDVIHSSIASGEHIFIIEEQQNGSVTVFHNEVFTGLLAPIIMLFARKSTHKGFELMNQALKVETEKQGRVKVK